MSYLSRIALAGCLLVAMTATAARQVVTLGVNEGAVAGQMEHEMAGVLAQLQTSPSIDVKLKVYPNHDALYAALKQNQVDLAFLGAVKYVEAHYEFGATPVVGECCNVRSFIAVMPNSPLKTVEQLRGKRFGFGYEDSTTTHLIPALMLSSHGIKQTDVVAEFLGHQPSRTVDALLAGKVDAIAVSDYVYGQNEGKIRVIEKSDEFPGPPITARKGLNPSVVAEVRRLMVAYKPKDKSPAQHFAKGASAVTDNDYNRIRFLCKVLFNKMYQ
jgi:phosphonate transport system substrate-binding protein